MMTDRKCSMGGIDQPLAKKEAKIFERKQAEIKRREKCQMESKEKTVHVASCSIENDNLSALEDFDDDDVEFEPEIASTPKPNRSHKRTIKTGLDIFIPHDFLKSPKVIQTLVRNKVSSTAISAVMSSIVESVGGETDRLNLSYKSVNATVVRPQIWYMSK